jgi:hypothetical protein
LSKCDALGLEFHLGDNSYIDNEFENILKSDIFPVSVADIGKRLANIFDKINDLKFAIDGEDFNSSKRLSLGSTIEDIEMSLTAASKTIKKIEKMILESKKRVRKRVQLTESNVRNEDFNIHDETSFVKNNILENQSLRIDEKVETFDICYDGQ